MADIHQLSVLFQLPRISGRPNTDNRHLDLADNLSKANRYPQVRALASIPSSTNSSHRSLQIVRVKDNDLHCDDKFLLPGTDSSHRSLKVAKDNDLHCDHKFLLPGTDSNHRSLKVAKDNDLHYDNRLLADFIRLAVDLVSLLDSDDHIAMSMHLLALDHLPCKLQVANPIVYIITPTAKALFLLLSLHKTGWTQANFFVKLCCLHKVSSDTTLHLALK